MVSRCPSLLTGENTIAVFYREEQFSKTDLKSSRSCPVRDETTSQIRYLVKSAVSLQYATEELIFGHSGRT
jgi:hypothetical protein